MSRRSPRCQTPGDSPKTPPPCPRFRRKKTCRWSRPARRRVGRIGRRCRECRAAAPHRRRNVRATTRQSPFRRGGTFPLPNRARPPARGRRIPPIDPPACRGGCWKSRRCARPCAPCWREESAPVCAHIHCSKADRVLAAPPRSGWICPPARRTCPECVPPAARPAP